MDAIDDLAAALAAGHTTASDALTDSTLSRFHADPRFRDLMRAHAPTTTLRITAPSEPGSPLVVSGVVRGKDGKPLDGALLYVFQTDATGFYAPGKAMDEPNARLFGYVRTGVDGRYEIRTIRPGAYPSVWRTQGEARRIPQHVHFLITAPAYQEAPIQMYFEDDPFMQPEWAKELARKKHRAAVTVTKDADGVLHCAADWTLDGR